LVVIVGIIAFALYYLMLKNVDAKEANTYIDSMINLTKILFYIAAIATVIGFILDIFESKKSLLYTLAAFAVFGIIVLLAYMKASHEPYHLNENVVYSASTSTWVDTGLWTFYYLVIIALISMLFTWVSDFFRS